MTFGYLAQLPQFQQARANISLHYCGGLADLVPGTQLTLVQGGGGRSGLCETVFIQHACSYTICYAIPMKNCSNSKLTPNLQTGFTQIKQNLQHRFTPTIMQVNRNQNIGLGKNQIKGDFGCFSVQI